MKALKESSTLESRTIALIAGLAVGLGIIVHEVFFLVAVGIWIASVLEWMWSMEHDHPGRRDLLYHHP